MRSKLKTFMMESGERYCLLIDSHSELPLFYPNLYVTTQVRNKSLSYSAAMEAILSSISVLIRFLDIQGENIEKRIIEGQLLQEHELDALKDFCQINFRSISNAHKNVHPFSRKKETSQRVSSDTVYVRITIISQYLTWLSTQILGVNQSQLSALQINKLEKSLKSRRPEKSYRNNELDNKGLDEEQIAMLFELFRPESVINPFKDKSVRTRNRLVFLMLYHLGIREGVTELIPWLYLKGLSTGDYSEALGSLLGEHAKGLSANTVSRLKSQWLDEHQTWQRQDLSQKRYVYWWADGIYSQVRMDDRLCLLVIIGVTEHGHKELVAVNDGFRESSASWEELLTSLRQRGLSHSPKLAARDGALGF